MTDKLLDTECPCCGFWVPEAVPQQPMTYYAPMKYREAAENARREALEGAVEVDIHLAPHGWFAMWKDGKKLVGDSVVPEGRCLIVPLERGDQDDDTTEDA